MSGDSAPREGHEDDLDHVRQTTPEEPQEPGPDPQAAPSAPASPEHTHTNAGGAGGGDRLDALERTVAGLVDIVAGLVPKDDRPMKVPWTHKGSSRRGEDQ